VQQILDFGRRAVLQARSLDLVSFLQEQIELWQRTIPESIKIHFSDEAINCIIKADPTRLQQVFTNLVLNARDAMPNGGDLRFSLKPLWLDRHHAAPLPDMTAGDWVKITVSDTGTGIPPATLAHIFEPFFTTKEPGQGSGLGLAQVYGIVKQHQGHIEVQSREDRGTTFTIYLPALVVTLPKATAVVTQSVPPQGTARLFWLWRITKSCARRWPARWSC
jgi:two-component system cell cycle sensor histidine kinase/response regulator CckA